VSEFGLAEKKQARDAFETHMAVLGRLPCVLLYKPLKQLSANRRETDEIQHTDTGNGRRGPTRSRYLCRWLESLASPRMLPIVSATGFHLVLEKFPANSLRMSCIFPEMPVTRFFPNESNNFAEFPASSLLWIEIRVFWPKFNNFRGRDKLFISLHPGIFLWMRSQECGRAAIRCAITTYSET
jgi:hypothetical protein